MSKSVSISVSRANADVAVLSFHDPSSQEVCLSRRVLAEVQDRLDALEADGSVRGLVITTADAETRLVGPDCRVSGRGEEDAKVGRVLVRRLWQSRLATLAAVQGPWLGAAVELAAWCDGRLMLESPSACLVLDQVQYGLAPMWGSPAILPRIVGPDRAIRWLTSAATVSPREAGEARFVEPVAPGGWQQACRAWLLKHLQTGSVADGRSKLVHRIGGKATDRAALARQALARIRSMPCEQRLAAAAVVQLVLDCCELSLDDGCELAAQRRLRLVGQMPARALVNVAGLAESLRADEGDGASGDQPQHVRRIAVLGAGIMGEGIAAANLRHNVPVVLQDASRDALDRCFQSLANAGRPAAGTHRQDAQATIAGADEELRDGDLLIETIVENKDVKQRVLKRLSPHLRDDAVVASNTSTIPISQLAESIPHPERFCGIHFCNPVERMPLVEVVRGQKTSDATLRSVVRYVRQIGKLPVVVNDCPGFLINRLLLLYMNEALTLYCEGVPLEQIENVAKAFGMECGPFELFDVIGVDTAMYGGKLLWEAFPDRISLTPVLPAMVKRSWLGKKQGRGFYRYDEDGHRGEVDAELQGILQAYVRPAGPRSDQQVLDRLLLAVLLEATRILEDGIVGDARDVDAGLVFGLGFPRRCGGLLFWADGVGAARLLQMLKPLAGLGARMQPTRLLRAMAEQGTGFYELEGLDSCDG